MTAATQALSATAWKEANYVPDAGRSGVLHIYSAPTVTVATTAIDEQNDIFELCYMPSGVTIHGFIIEATDMDTGSAALVYKLRIGGTDVVTGITSGQAAYASGAPFYCTPTTTTAITLIDAKVTTAAATAAQGTIKLRVLYTV